MLFEDPASPEQRARHAVVRAFQQSTAEWLACYEPVLCRGEAEPPRVVMRFRVEGGRVHEPRVTEVTEFEWDGTEQRVRARRGELEGALARCLLEFARSLRVAMPSLLPSYDASFVFRPDTSGC